MDRGGAHRGGVVLERVHFDLAHHHGAGFDLERVEHHGLSGHRRVRLERQHPEDGLPEEVWREGHLHRVHLHRGRHRLRGARADLAGGHQRLPHVGAVVPHHRGHVAVPERGVVGVVHGDLHVHREVDHRRDDAERRDLRAHHRRHHARRPRLEQGEVERHEDGGEDDGDGQHGPAADQHGLPLHSAEFSWRVLRSMGAVAKEERAPAICKRGSFIGIADIFEKSSVEFVRYRYNISDRRAVSGTSPQIQTYSASFLDDTDFMRALSLTTAVGDVAVDSEAPVYRESTEGISFLRCVCPPPEQMMVSVADLS
ncbi:hypothetical protein EJB05_12203, partial [Eragrostis curvula]